MNIERAIIFLEEWIFGGVENEGEFRDVISLLRQLDKYKQILENLKYEMSRRGNKKCLQTILYLEKKHLAGIITPIDCKHCPKKDDCDIYLDWLNTRSCCCEYQKEDK